MARDGQKKGYILALTLIQGTAGVIGVVYALLFRAVVDSAVAKETADWMKRRNKGCWRIFAV